MDKVRRLKELVTLLNSASGAYYQKAAPIMSDREYDALYDELILLEDATGIVMSNSPTRNVGYEVISGLPKENHETPMLSLNKTKDAKFLKTWLGSNVGVMSWKLDGLTVVLTYKNGCLEKAVTRGNGYVGELITNNVKCFSNIPLTIHTKCDIVVIRGEAVLDYHEFNKINSESSLQYKNPRNLCSGTIRQLNNEIVAKRNVRFIAFELVTPKKETMMDAFDFLTQQGFEVVEHKKICGDIFEDVFDHFKINVETLDIPTDGLVLRLNDLSYGDSLGKTDKFPKHSMAFKWADEVAPTALLNIEWSTSRTGLINPVAVFEPVELEGTTVERASLHNISYLKQLQLGIGDEITVYKANMIIPQVAENLTKSNSYQIPDTCPECGSEAAIHKENDSELLYCTNPNCKAKLIARLTHFASRDCMNIVGLSEETLKKLADFNFVDSFYSIYELKNNSKAIYALMKIPGMGRKSVNNLLDSIEKSRDVTLDKFIASLGIPGIGKKQAKQISDYFDGDFERYQNAIDSNFNFRALSGFGDVLCKSVNDWYRTADIQEYRNLTNEMRWVKELAITTSQKLNGKTFVITGSLSHFSNRQSLQAEIESAGGKVGNSITSKTSYLINNDPNSSSSKNQKAKQLNIPIISEQDFIQMLSNWRGNYHDKLF